MNENLYCTFATLNGKSEKTALRRPCGPSISFADLDHLAAQMANVLRSHGIEAGDRVAVKASKTPESLALYLGCLRVGAIYLPMNTAYTQDEVAYILGDAEPSLAVFDPESTDQAPCPVLHLDAHGKGSLIDALGAADTEIIKRDKDDIAAILYTSGTTGRPKGAMLSHGNLSSNAITLCKAWHFSEDDVLLHALPIFHAHGLFVAANMALMMGNETIFLQNFKAEDVLAHIKDATVYMGVPTHYVRLLKHTDLTAESVANMRLFISGSAPLLPEHFTAFETRTGHRILERYGMTETVMNCSNPYEGPRIPGSVGPALPGIDARLSNKDGAVGVLEIRGPNVFKGYWRKPDITAKAFTEDGYFITGDLAEIDDDGRVRLVGRANDMIISGGFNVYPLEVEELLNRMGGIEESAVIAVPHEDFGEAVVAVYTGKEADEAVLKNQLKAKLAPYKTPKRFIHVPDLPRNTMGKVEKAKLRAGYKNLFQD